MPDYAIEIDHLYTTLDGQSIHRDLNLRILPGEIVAIVGGSGSGKTTLLNCLLMLVTPQSGTIKICGQNTEQLTEEERAQLRTQCGILFQGGALFSELTVLENVRFPMEQHSNFSLAFLTKLAKLKIAMAELPADSANKMPDDLSGGMIKRAAMARSIALDPSLLFLDEASAGLDPISASGLDQLILALRASLQLTIVMVTHDLDTLATVPDRIAFLGNGTVLAYDTLPNLLSSSVPEVKAYFQSKRAQRTFGDS